MTQGKSTENPDSLEAFRHRLSLLAGRKRLKQSEIARRLSTPENRISPQRVGGWFQGRHFPGGEIEHALAALLGVSRDWLIEGKDTPDSTDTTVAENGTQVTYGTPQAMEAEARGHIEKLILAAKGQPARLGWIVEQLKEHAEIPKNWRAGAEVPMGQLTDDHLKALAYGAALRAKDEPVAQRPAKQFGAGR